MAGNGEAGPRTRRTARAPQPRLQECVLETHCCPLTGLTNQEGPWNSEAAVVVAEAEVQSLNGQPGPNGRSDTEFRHPIAVLQEPMLNLKKKAI